MQLNSFEFNVYYKTFIVLAFSWTNLLSISSQSLSSLEEVMPSTMIVPPAGSTRRNKAPMRVDFPLPVLPTIPILCPPSNVHVMPLSTRGEPVLYLICFSLNRRMVYFFISIHIYSFNNFILEALK